MAAPCRGAAALDGARQASLRITVCAMIRAWRRPRCGTGGSGCGTNEASSMGLLDIFKGKLLDPTAYSGVHAGGDIITTRLDAVVKWGRKSSIWPMPFGTACCAIEFMAFTASHYDVARFGAEVLRFSPRQADLLFVAGTIPDKLGPVLRTIYDQMPEPKWVLSMGVCASSGGMFNNYAIVQGVDQIVPVDVYVPGCPPGPETLMHGILTLHDQIRTGELLKRREASPTGGAAIALDTDAPVPAAG
jgi:NADH-quinone oxidoreductase subunit B